jgi:flagellar hook-basal body complex protein FliE
MMLTGIESIAAVSGSQLGTAVGAPTQGQDVSAPDTFADMMQSKLDDLGASVGAAEEALRDLASGKSVQPHEVMITLERARISVLTFVQLRNKLVESYQDVMRMQL